MCNFFVFVISVAEGPTDLTVVVLNGSCVTVKFRSVQTSNEYYIRVMRDNELFPYTLSSINTINGSLSQRVNGLMPNTTYTVKVIANVGGQNSTESTTTATTGKLIILSY